MDREGVRLALTRRAGSGRPLLIVPGVMADAVAWQPVVDALDVAGPVYVLNRRGRKPSGALGPNYSMRTEIDDLDRVLDEIVAAEGAEHGVDLFGWSFGGLVALEAAARRTGSVHSLTLYEPVVRPFGRGALAALREAAAADDLDRALEIVNRDVSGFSEEDVAQLRRSAAWEVLRPLAAPLAQELTALDEHPADLRAFGALDLPVTLLLGAENEGVPPYGDVFAEIAAALPRARVVTMPGQGHLAHAQAPESLARHIGQALHRAERRDPDVGLS
ncbi:alpha/beta fold hydrolase [Streptomyces fulvoviolaceus]|uniref:alpha/beta fold hydrolase n=1 Tax=Streptomyces fulvoviolaceus TaxID=285535 RepID=UPI000B213135|nr:alpha/beta hydrolase [Streptomyces fulvoviolaceus]MCT9080667.1 alpha/beta hydrolase [Streptomyces fulvoviolaceus]